MRRKAADSEEIEEDSENECLRLKKIKTEILKMFYHGDTQQEEVEMKEKEGGDDEAEIQEKKFKDIWRNANMLKYVAPIPVKAEAITDTPDALLPMIKMDPKTFHVPP